MLVCLVYPKNPFWHPRTQDAFPDHLCLCSASFAWGNSRFSMHRERPFFFFYLAVIFTPAECPAPLEPRPGTVAEPCSKSTCSVITVSRIPYAREVQNSPFFLYLMLVFCEVVMCVWEMWEKRLSYNFFKSLSWFERKTTIFMQRYEVRYGTLTDLPLNELFLCDV